MLLDAASADDTSLMLPRMEAEVRVYTVDTFGRMTAAICYGFSGVNDVSMHHNGESSFPVAPVS